MAYVHCALAMFAVDTAHVHFAVDTAHYAYLLERINPSNASVAFKFATVPLASVLTALRVECKGAYPCRAHAFTKGAKCDRSPIAKKSKSPIVQ